MDTAFKEEDTVKDKINIATWLKTFKYVFDKWPVLLLLVFAMFITAFYDSSFVPSMSAALIRVFDDSSSVLQENIRDTVINLQIMGISINIDLLRFILSYVFMILLRSLAVFTTFYSMNYLEVIIMTSLRRDAYRRIQELSFSYFDKTSSGWLIARLQNDAASIGEVLSYGVLRIFWVSFDLLLTLITMFTVDRRYSLIILATTPFIALIVLYFQKRMLSRHRIARNAYSYFVGWLAESINGNKTIKTLAIEEPIYKEGQETTKDVQIKRYRAIVSGAFFQPSISMLSALTSAAIIVVFTLLKSDNTTIFNTATLVLFLGFVGQIYNPIQEFADIFSELMATQASVEKLFSLIETKPQLVDKPEVIEKYGDIFHNKTENFPEMKGDILFDHVSFSYNTNTEVLHDLYLHIDQGKTIAIVGETGSGKSTTVNLLCRFYEPTKGKITIDDVDYRDRSVGWLRSNIGYVQQTPFIFKGTIVENVRYGKLNATQEEIEKACKEVDLDKFISTLPKGYQTMLDNGGGQLSQGQKQLIAFARAIVRNPRILILDEATSSIDTETEQVVQKALRKSLKGRTSIIIAHRLSTIVDSDRIVVMKDGKLIEDGNHISLMNKKGYYYELYMNQFKELDIDKQIETYKSQIEDTGIKI
jgi:ATP-binding cassette subfamily B protein